MILYIIFIIISIYLKISKVYLYIVLLFSTSIISAIIIKQPIEWFSFDSIIPAGYTSFLLFLMFYGYNLRDEIRLEDAILIYSGKKRLVISFVLLSSMLALIINVGILIKSASFFRDLAISVSEFKNQGVSEAYVSSISPYASFLSLVLSPLSYLALAIHFYALLTKQRKVAFWSLLASLNIAIVPLFYLARGGLITYILLYFGMMAVVFDQLNNKYKRQVIKTILFFLTILAFVFYLISVDRFSSYSYYRTGTIISNQVLFSLLDYLSQWVVNSEGLFWGFDYSRLIFGSNFTYLPSHFLSIFGIELNTLQELRESAFPTSANKFNGVVALLVYDFGYLGALLFSFCYYLCVLKAKKIYSVNTLSGLVLICVAMPIPLFFFQGLFTAFGFYNIAVLYSLAFGLFLRLKI